VTVAPFTRERIHELFAALSAELGRRGQRAELFLVGGSPCCSVLGFTTVEQGLADGPAAHDETSPRRR